MAVTKLERILVVDVEATCWPGEPPEGQESEIIEIGVCTLSVMTGERMGRESILVRPQRSTVSPYCTQLTTLTQAQVDTGTTFEEACRRLVREFDSRALTWASYGNYDRLQFERQCREWGVAFPFGPTHINVKNLFALQHRLAREVGLDRALKILDLPLEGTHHRGDDDAWNIAAVLQCVLLNGPETARSQGERSRAG